MADNYTQGTVAPFIPLTGHQLEALATSVEDLPEPGDWGDQEPNEAEEMVLRWEDQYELETNTGLTAERWGKGEGLYYLYTEYGLNIGGAEVLQEILRGLPEEEYPHITYEYAETCSKMRPGEFGGGAIFITREEIVWTNSSEWLRQRASQDVHAVFELPCEDLLKQTVGEDATDEEKARVQEWVRNYRTRQGMQHRAWEKLCDLVGEMWQQHESGKGEDGE